jgi:hypothetical protein
VRVASRALAAATCLSWGCTCAPSSAAPGRAGRMETVPERAFCVTLGTLRARPGGLLGIDDAKVRAVVASSSGSAAELRFTYLGPTEQTAPLASGQVRRQVGLKLRAEDGCNLIYVMWRFEPRAELVVSVKRNPGQTTHAACGTRGYTQVKPSRAAPVPRPSPGEKHVLAAGLSGHTLEVRVDGVPAWRGRLGDEAVSLAGPVGLRADNARVDLALLTALGPRRPDACAEVGARAGGGGEE